MKKLILMAALAVFFVLGEGWDSPAHAQAPKCYPIGYRSAVIIDEKGYEVVQTHTQPAANDPNMIITWEMWLQTDMGLWGLTGHNGIAFCIFEEGQGITPPRILQLIQNTRDKPQGTSI